MFSLNLSPKPHRRSRRLQRVMTDASRAGAVEKLEDRALLAEFPRLSSLEGAPVTLFIDADGHTETSAFWTSNNNGQDIITPPYDTNGDYTFLTDQEAQEITDIWAEVAEDFAPFNVNVTTIDPGTYNNFETLVIVMGGDGQWFNNGSAGGVAPINAFSNSAPNVGFTFSEVQRTVFNNAMTNSHEAGHGFGLQHQSLYDENGSKQQEYHPGFGEYGPIMGAPFGTTRSIWHDGRDTNGVQQLDMERLTRSANRTFVDREDEHGGTIATASRPDYDDAGVFSVQSVIVRHTDTDWQRIETGAGLIEFDVEVLDHSNRARTPGTNLNVILRLRDASGNILEEDAPTDSYGASLSYEATEGTYFVEVAVQDLYGTAGAYTLNGDVIPLPQAPTMLGPTGVVGARPIHSWTQTVNTASYELQVNNITTGQDDVIRVDGLPGTSYTPVFSLNDDHMYEARARSLNNEGKLSEWSEFTTYTVDVPPPGASEILAPRGRITDATPTWLWAVAENADTYDLRITNIATEEVVIFRTGIRGTEYTHFASLPEGEYNSEVRAVNEAGEVGVYSAKVRFVLEVERSGDPEILEPGNGKISIRRPTIKWTRPENAVAFDFRMQNLSTGEKNFIRKNNYSETSFRPNRKLDQGTYLLEVRAIDILGRKTDWSEEVIVTIDVPTPAVPQFVSPAEGETLASQFPTFEWKEKARRAKKYRLIVLDQNRDDVEVLRKTINGGNVLEFLSNKKIPESDNLVALLASINSVGELSEYAQVEFGIDVQKPSRSELLAPSVNINGKIDTDRPTYLWSTSTNAVSYTLVVKLRSSGKTVLKQKNIKDTSWRFDERLDEGKQYEVTVVAKNSAGEEGNVSKPLRFVVDVPEPDTPVMYGPQGDITARRPTLDWENVAFATKVQLFVKNLDTNSTERYVITDWQVSGDGEIASYRLPDKLRKGTYQAWARALNSRSEKSGYSNQVTFSIVSSDSIPKAELPREAPVVEEVEQPQTQPAEVEDIRHIVVVEQPQGNVQTASPAADASAAAMTEFIENDWWVTEADSEGESPATESESDSQVEVSTAEVAIAAAALPLFAGKLLKRFRRKKNQNDE